MPAYNTKKAKFFSVYVVIMAQSTVVPIVVLGVLLIIGLVATVIFVLSPASDVNQITPPRCVIIILP